MSNHARLFLIFGCVAAAMSVFPPPVREGFDAGMARTTLAIGLTLLIAALTDFIAGFIEGWQRSKRRRRD